MTALYSCNQGFECREWIWEMIPGSTCGGVVVGNEMKCNEANVRVCSYEWAPTVSSWISILLGAFVKLHRTHLRVLSHEGKEAGVFIHHLLPSFGGWLLPDTLACPRQSSSNAFRQRVAVAAVESCKNVGSGECWVDQQLMLQWHSRSVLLRCRRYYSFKPNWGGGGTLWALLSM